LPGGHTTARHQSWEFAETGSPSQCGPQWLHFVVVVCSYKVVSEHPNREVLMPQAVISVTSGRSSELVRPLAEWLRGEDELRGHVRVADQLPEPSQMGAVADAIIVSLGSGGAFGVMINSLFRWLRQRQAGAKVYLHLADERGRELDLELDGSQDAETLVGKVLNHFEGTARGRD